MATDRKVKVRLEADPKGFIAGMKAAGRAVSDLRNDIDTTNDRTAWLAQSFLALGPMLAPVGAAGVPALAGLTTQLGLTAAAAGTAVLAFNGVFDALDALNKYQIDPTDKNLENLQVAMREIGPEGAHFVRFLDSIGPAFSKLSNISRANLFPGVEDGIRTFVDDLLPRLYTIVGRISGAMGDLAREAGEGLSGPKWESFFEFLRTEAEPLLRQLGRTVGNFATGFANMVVAFGPLTERFSKDLLRVSRAFAEWSSTLDTNEGFQGFLAYVEQSIPPVLALFESLVHAMVAIIQAAAPVGEVMLPAFTAFFDVVAKLAETPLAPIFIAGAAAASLYGRAVALASITTGGAFGKITQRTKESAAAAVKARIAWRDLGSAMIYAGHSQRDFLRLSKTGAIGAEEAAHAMNARKNLQAYAKQVAGTAGQVGLLAVAMSDLDDQMGLTNTAMGALMGSMAGPWGAALGAAAGYALDFAKANDELVESIERADTAAKGDDLSQMLEERSRLIREINSMKAEIRNDDLDLFEMPDWSKLLNPGEGLGLKDGLFGDDVTKAEKELDQLNASIEETAFQARILASLKGPRGMGQTFRDIEPDIVKAKLAMEDFSEEILAVQNILDRSGSLIAYERALDDLTKSIEENGNSWDVGTEKGRSNLEARNALVEKAILRAQALKDAGDDLGAQKILNRAIGDLQRFVGDSEGARRKAIKPLIDALKDVDGMKAKPKIEVDNKQALAEIDQVKTAFDALKRHLRIELQSHMDIRLDRGQGAGFATGGYTGFGGKYEPAGIVHRKEFVFSSEATEGNVAMLTQLHNHLRGFASGGYVGATAQPAAPVGAGIDYDRLAGAMLRARPLYGNVEVHGDGSFERAMRQDAKLAAKGGY